MSNELSWWAALKHGGLLLSAERLAELFPAEAPAIPDYLVTRLRGNLQRIAESAKDDEARAALLDTVLHDLAGMRTTDEARWFRGNDVPRTYARRAASGEMVSPRRLWAGPRGAGFPVFVDDEPRIGQGRGRRSVSRVIEWCRGTGHTIALLTNTRQFRLLYVGTEHDAYCEWDTAQWFESGAPSHQVEALVHLLAPRIHTPATEGGNSPLLDAILRSRQGQSQLTALLGERVRQAVEVLIHAHAPYLSQHTDLEKADIYRAGTLMVMRLVVGLFAEARDLFPRSNRIYETGYGLQGLWEKLARAGGGRPERLRSRYGAWPQILALFRLIHDGSHHAELPLRAYGGELFRPGEDKATDGVRRAMHLFETACYKGTPSVMSDAEVHKLLELLTRCAMSVRQGNARTTVIMPVDFADLSTEYIGILYEGLLDYELHQVPVEGDDPVLFVNLGDQPALPLSRLAGITGNALKTFFKEFSKRGGTTTDSAEEAEEESEETEAEDAPSADVDETDAPAAEDESDLESAQGAQLSARQRAIDWARKAVVAAEVVKPFTGADPARRAASDEKVDREAKRLVLRTVLPGDFYLVRWGGTRKGRGSFYTRPGLVAPTVLRTLAPLCYNLPENPSFEQLRDPGAPRTPLDILGLKICDPATGSASFPVSALRYLTEALWRSLLHHGWLRADGAHDTFAPGANLPADAPAWFRECLLDLPGDIAAAEGTIRARLKRLIVERCLYGVDLDPLAIELARLSLWIETMDRDLPFGFLDHKFKCGNGLVGCRFDRIQEYPALCLHRPTDDAGDKSHATGVHLAKGRLSEALKEFRNETLKPALVRWLESRDPGTLAFLQEGQSVADLQNEAIRRMEELHAIPVHDTETRSTFYRTRVEPALAPLRAAFDTWCALWFWPVSELQNLPLPATYASPSAEALAIVARLSHRLRFFHWELEFPDVFTGPDSGFHAILGNPPWETLQPVSKEWFSNHDPLYRTYGKQEALRRQRELFARDAHTEHDWVDYCAEFKALANWCANSAFPWADPVEEAAGGTRWALARSAAAAPLHQSWRARRATRRSFCSAAAPFRHQGDGKPHTYKLFLEQMHALLRTGGRVGVIVPSNIYTDQGSTALRRLFLNHCRWEWIFGIENREGIFDIHRSFKFCAIIVQKGGATGAIRTAFMRRKLTDWAEAETHAVPYAREMVERFSPKSLAILELRTARDAAILDTMYRNGVLLGDDSSRGWGLKYRQGDFNMTSDSALFPPRLTWEADGYRPDEYGHWLQGRWEPVATDAPWKSGGTDWLNQPWRRSRSILRRPEGLIISRDGQSCIRLGDITGVALPLYEGRMIDHFDFSAKGWVSGKGRTAVWRDIPWDNKVIEPQYLMGCRHFTAEGDRIGYMDIASATNSRTMISTAMPHLPCGNKVPVLFNNTPFSAIRVTQCLNSFAFDFHLRQRLGGLTLNYFIIEETSLPSIGGLNPRAWKSIEVLSLALSSPSTLFSPQWASVDLVAKSKNWKSLWAITAHERLRIIAVSNALVSYAYGLGLTDFANLCSDCDHPVSVIRRDEFSRSLDPKGFWRVDKEHDPELRHTVLAQVAFQDLQRMGLDAFLAQNNGEGWMLPETLRLSDYRLGHDDRAHEPQPVAARLGPRFYDWQTEGTVEESWEECRRHAALIRAIRAHGTPAAAAPAIIAQAASGPATPTTTPPPSGGITQPDLF